MSVAADWCLFACALLGAGLVALGGVVAWVKLIDKVGMVFGVHRAVCVTLWRLYGKPNRKALSPACPLCDQPRAVDAPRADPPEGPPMPGEVVRATVENVAAFGAYLKHGSTSILVEVGDIAADRAPSVPVRPADHLRVGDEVYVKIKRIAVSGSIKDAAHPEDP